MSSSMLLLASSLPILLTVVPFLIRLLATTTPTPPIIISTLSALHAHAYAHRTSFPTTVLTPRQRQVLDHILDQSSLRHDYPEEADPAEILCAHFPALLLNSSDAQRVVRFIFESAPIKIYLNVPRVLPHLLVNDDEKGQNYYKNLFEIDVTTMNIHNDNLTERFQLQSTLFDGLYDEDVLVHDRIKYGILDVGFPLINTRQHGHSHLELKPSVRYRCSYSYGDSGKWKGALNLTVLETLIPEQIINHWTPKDMRSLMVAAAAATGDKEVQANVEQHLTKYDHEQKKLKQGPRVSLTREPPQVWYIEAQIHGPVNVRRDLSALVVDKYYQGNATLLRQLDAFTAKFGVPYRWTEEVVGEKGKASKPKK
jgi:hypothetical protein